MAKLLYIRCKRCNRELRQDKSVKRGFGYVCWKKHVAEEAERFFRENQMSIYDFID